MDEHVEPAGGPLQTVRTETLPEGALFVGPDGVLYQVVMAGSAGFRKAEPWPWLSQGWVDAAKRPTAVALVSGSLLARNYPVMAEGRPLPTMSRSDFLSPDGQPGHYTFPDERLARLAAQLDETLARQSGLAVRKEGERYVLSDGQHTFRVYYYQTDSVGRTVDVASYLAEEHVEARPCEQGSYYWRYVPGWEEALSPPERATELSLESAIEAMIAEVAATVIAQPVGEPEKLEEPKRQPASPTKKETQPRARPRRKSKASKRRRTPAMILSLDIGYGYTKGIGPNGLRFSFPSVIGNVEDIRFATDLIRGEEERPVQYGNRRFFYGKQAMLQSRIQSAIFDRSRVHDDTYKMLFVAALVETAKVAPDGTHVKVVTGLPVGFFGDQDEVVKLFEGTHQVTTGHALKFVVESVFVAPQPFGSLFRELLNEQGKIVAGDVEKGRVGIIDVGTYTTDFVVSDELRYVRRLSGSIPVGWSVVTTRVQQAIGDLLRLELLPHEVDRAVQAGEVRLRGEPVPLEPLIEPAVADIEAAVTARTRDLWGEGAHLDAILVSGGGGPYLYKAIHSVYPHARLLDNAFWANAEGLYRFGQRPATFEE